MRKLIRLLIIITIRIKKIGFFIDIYILKRSKYHCISNTKFYIQYHLGLLPNVGIQAKTYKDFNLKSIKVGELENTVLSPIK